MAESRRPRRLLHAREELALGLGFHGEVAYRGRRGQAWAGIGRGEVEEGRRGRRTCMQELGLGRGFHRGLLVYGISNVGSTFFLHESENQVRSRQCNGAPGCREE
jgi:hypothetical protein